MGLVRDKNRVSDAFGIVGISSLCYLLLLVLYLYWGAVVVDNEITWLGRSHVVTIIAYTVTSLVIALRTPNFRTWSRFNLSVFFTLYCAPGVAVWLVYTFTDWCTMSACS